MNIYGIEELAVFTTYACIHVLSDLGVTFKGSCLWSGAFYTVSKVLVLTAAYGLIKAVMQTMPPSEKSLDTSEIRRMFSSLSSWVKPRFLLRPVRILSPSKLYAGIP